MKRLPVKPIFFIKSGVLATSKNDLSNNLEATDLPFSTIVLTTSFSCGLASSSVFCLAILSASFFSASMRVFSSASARSRSSAAFLSASAFSVAMRSASALAATSLCASATAFSFSLIDRNNSSGVSSVPLPPSASSLRLEKIPMRKGRPNTLSDRPSRKSSVKAYCYT